MIPKIKDLGHEDGRLFFIDEERLRIPPLCFQNTWKLSANKNIQRDTIQTGQQNTSIPHADLFAT
jgi:hypothetical protein